MNIDLTNYDEINNSSGDTIYIGKHCYDSYPCKHMVYKPNELYEFENSVWLTGYLKSNRYNVPNHFKNYDKYRPI